MAKGRKGEISIEDLMGLSEFDGETFKAVVLALCEFAGTGEMVEMGEEKCDT